MNPLLVRIITGLEDAKLFEHISFLEACQRGRNGSSGISSGELTILQAAYKRLDELTKPN